MTATQFSFDEEHQPNEKAWQEVTAFVKRWNASNIPRFEQHDDSVTWTLTLHGFGDDEPAVRFEKLIKEQLSKHDVQWLQGVFDLRGPKDYEKADYVKILGNGYEPRFTPNIRKLTSPETTCQVCKKDIRFERPIMSGLIVDETYLDRQVDPSDDYKPPGLDLINLPFPASSMLCSARFADVLEASQAQGHQLNEVISKATLKPSTRLFQLTTKRAVLEPCYEHSLAPDHSVCAACGRIHQYFGHYFHFNPESLKGDNIFSRSRFLDSSIYVENSIYHALKDEGMRGMVACSGIFACDHS